jgi:glycoside/pentoside/hexuronide:cation symporter, GPH family
LIAISGLACFQLTAGTPTGDPSPPVAFSWREKLTALLQNRPFVILILAKVLLYIGLGMHGTGIAYFTKHVLHYTDYSLGSLLLLQTLAMLLSQPLWVAIANRYGRRNGLQIAITFDVLIYCTFWFVTPEYGHLWLAVLGPLKGIASGGEFLNVQSMLPDTMNYDQQRYGLRREGLFAGIFVMVEKFTAAIAAALFGWIIGAMGYAAAAGAGGAQPAEALVAIRACVSLLPSLILVGAMILLTRYRLQQHSIDGSDTRRVNAETSS